jgi:type II secretory pathway pseudopilin PulG
MIELLLVFAIVAALALFAALLWRRRSRLAAQQSHEQGYAPGREGIRRDGGTPSP